ncbi:MAG TPA: ABC transporter permease [Gemmatimonadaceae bacterium]|nr:ABC transporter permease [Gemmatimonadaceae bacterium]
MWAFVGRRVLQAALVVFLVSSLTFFLVHLAPGDPFSGTLSDARVSEAVRQQWRTAFGLDRPLADQYWLYLRNVARGDLGYSFSTNRPVSAALADAIPNTLLLMGVALVASFAIGVGLGIVQAARRRSIVDRALTGASLFVYSMPDFWLAAMVMLLLGYWVPVFPVSGMLDPVIHDYLGFWGRVRDIAYHMVLPAATLTLLSAAGIARHQRSAMLEASSKDFVLVARAKGATERQVVLRHVFRNALIPVITLLGLAFPYLLGGSVFVEKVFSWPGMGYLTVQAIGTRDYPLVTAAVLIGSLLVTLGNLLADLLHAWADPRVRAH